MMLMKNINEEKKNQSADKSSYQSASYSVRRRGKNVDSSSKSNPLHRRIKNYDAST